MVEEYFAFTKSEINLNKNEITCKTLNENSYGNLCIDSDVDRIHHWKFKISSLKSKLYKIESQSLCAPIIGISDSTHTNCGKLFTSYGKGYGLSRNGNLYSVNSKNKKTYYLSYCGQQFKQNDIVRMKLDLYQQTLSFSINNTDWIIIDNIKIGKDIKYRIGVFLGLTDDRIQLLSYHNVHYSLFDTASDVDEKQKEEKVPKFCKLRMKSSPNKCHKPHKDSHDRYVDEYPDSIHLIEGLQEQLLQKIKEIEQYKENQKAMEALQAENERYRTELLALQETFKLMCDLEKKIFYA